MERTSLSKIVMRWRAGYFSSPSLSLVRACSSSSVSISLSPLSSMLANVLEIISWSCSIVYCVLVFPLLSCAMVAKMWAIFFAVASTSLPLCLYSFKRVMRWVEGEGAGEREREGEGVGQGDGDDEGEGEGKISLQCPGSIH